MARCGCAAGCSCVVRAGSDNVHVAGNGSDAAPYEMSVDVPEPTAVEYDVVSDDKLPADGDLTDRYYPPRDCSLVRVLASLEVAGSTDSVVTVQIDGASVDTVTIPAGLNVFMASIGPFGLAAATNYVNLEATTVGTGASGLVCVQTYLPT